MNGSLQPGQRPYSHLGMFAFVSACITGFEFAALASGLNDLGNRIGPICLGLAATWALVKLLRASPMLFLSAFPWALIATLAYSAIGPLVLVFGTPETIHSYHIGLQLRPEELLQTNILNAAFISIVGAVFYFARSGSHVTQNVGNFIRNLDDLAAARALVFVCLGIGLPIQVFLNYPLEFGNLNFVVPSSILRLGGLTTLALIPAWFLFGSRQLTFAPIAIALFSVELSMAVITFSKSSVLMCLLFPGIGYYFAKRSQRFLTIFAMLLVMCYLIIDPIVKVCREEGGLRTRTGYTPSLKQRANLLSRVVRDENGIRTRRTSDNIQYGWRRLNYSNAQYFVMRFYNQGREFNSYKNAFWALAPRILFPNKPNMTDLGVELNYLINKHRGSSMAVGIPAEAYGVGGHLYVILAAIFVGLIFAFLDSRYAFNMEGGWLYLPVQIICMRMGYRLDGAMVPDYIGSLVIVIAYSFFARFLVNQWLKPRRAMMKRQQLAAR